MNETDTNPAPAGAQDATGAGAKKSSPWWNVRDAIAAAGGQKAAKEYDDYVREHSRRLRGLQRLVETGHMPSETFWG